MPEKDDAEAYFKAIHELSKNLGIPAQTIYDLRDGFCRKHRTGGFKGKRKRPNGMLSSQDCTTEYGIAPEVLRKWRGMGMPTERQGSMILVSRAVLGKWMEENIDDLD